MTSPLTRLLPAALATAAVLTAPRPAAAQAPGDVARWRREAASVTIVRDDWGIAHVRGKTDADAVFGMEYAQAEDDFHRVEMNYVDALGRQAEHDGAAAIYHDLRSRIFADPDTLRAEYARSPVWLRQLMDAFADGLNFYLYRHPEVKPEVITHFEPWMALAFSEGSIGGDIERVNLQQLAAFYGGAPVPRTVAAAPGRYVEPTGSNGIAIAPSNTLDHHALLLINPHTSFYFRSELQMASDQGLDAYGAVTWGQFFIYQGFNDRVGWMHTSSGVDAVDEYLETVVKKGDRYYYRYGATDRPMMTTTVTVPYRTATGMARQTFTVFHTVHGPVVRKTGGKWVSIALMQRPVQALIQSFTRTKARTYAAFARTVALHANSSNNTVYADADGNIAYFQADFIPRRDPRFDYSHPVNGADPATAWHGVLSVNEAPHLLNPPTGWLYNTNDAPWTAAGPYSPRRADYPPYVETGSENPRGVHATRLLQGRRDFTLDRLVTAAFDSYLPEFARLVPRLLRAWDGTPASDPLRGQLAPQIATLRGWDYRWGAASIPTSLAVFWGEAAGRLVGTEARTAGMSADDYVARRAAPAELLRALALATDTLTADYGTWRTPWGAINRFQRISPAIRPHFSDAAPSIPVPFTSSRWGSLASFGARPYPNTKKWYGTSGNSFVAAVQFGDSVRARAVTAGGESGHPDSPHFDDEATRYATGDLRPVYFYPSQLRAHTERTYHPGS